jgi:sarcosine oxidase, subunit alpha
MTQPFRLPAGGQIDRGRLLEFTFDGRRYEGHPGDTLASALLANGVRLVARSIKYHRPRGILAAGPEEPSALVQLETGGEAEPNLRATEIALYDGLAARSQNAWPRLGADLGAIAGPFSPLLAAGFYYKTFLWPQRAWQAVWEPLLRRLAGHGRAPAAPDPGRYVKTHAHCDVLVVGSGPAGLAAALAAGRGGARVILAEAQAQFGGSLLWQRRALGAAWVRAVVAELSRQPEVALLPRTIVFGYYDDNCLMAVEQVGGEKRQILWHIRAGRVVLATGALERPLVFAGNDRPGVMLAGAVERYVNQYAVAPGRRAVLFTNNDGAYRAARALLAAGVDVAAVVDVRPEPGAAALQHLEGLPLHPGHAVVATRGPQVLHAVEIGRLGGEGGRQRIACDLLAVSGGWSPAVHLFSQSGGRLLYDERLAAFIPGEPAQRNCPVGAGNGSFGLAACLAAGAAAGARAAADCGFGDGAPPPMPQPAEPEAAPLQPLWLAPGNAARAFVDLQTDTTAADIALAAREGLVSIEHVKRYTTMGMGTDQGKTGGVNALALLSAAIGSTIAETGITTFRPPYTPVTFGALAGRERGRLLAPLRVTPMHDWHRAAGAVFEDFGEWRRARYYPRPGENMAAAVRRECLAARDAAALFDASTLGKIEIVGPDVGRFLDRIYINRWRDLRVGRCRYGVMCREDGMVFDDGVGARLADDRFLITTTTGNAAAVLDWLEEWLQTEWTELAVFCTAVTEQWANLTLVGPQARAVLARLAPGVALDREAFPFMSWREAEVAGIPSRLFRISYSGELAFEINVPSDCGLALWQALIEAGAAHGITPYGTEAMHIMRAEKGFMMVGHETDGSVTPLDLGLAHLIKPEEDFLGRRSLRRRDTSRLDRKQLVGLLPEDPEVVVPEGAQLGADPQARPPTPTIGYVTSSYHGARIGRSFALALVESGRSRHGQRVFATAAGRTVAAQICPSVFYDPEGGRRDG